MNPAPEPISTAEWSRLIALRPGATVFSGPQVQGAHVAAFGLKPHMLVARDGAELASIWPMVSRKLNVGPLRLTELGFARNAHTLRNDLLLPSNAMPVLTALFRACRNVTGWQTLALDNIPDDPTLAVLIPKAARATGLVVDRPSTGRTLLFADPGSDHEAYLATRSGQFRRQLKKRDRELHSLGEVRIEAVSGTALVAALPDWKAVTAASWQGKTPEASALTSADWALHRALSACGKLWLLRLSGRPIAALRMLEDAQTAYVHTMHFDRDFSDHAPGLVLFAAMMKDASLRGLVRVDFNGASPFFARWATGDRQHLNWRLYPKGLSGQTLRLARHGLALLRRTAINTSETEAAE